MDEDKLKRLAGWVEEARRIVFFGGAGVSTESGIPDFRGVDGLYSQKFSDPPETIISHTYYLRKPKVFFEFYRTRMLYPDAQPNIAHIKLAQWEREGRLLAVVTQNIDGLHQKAGSRAVYELHGSVHRNTCQRCGARYSLEEFLTLGEVPVCRVCGGRVKPDVVLYEEPLDHATVEGALDAIRRADLLIVAGTSLTVYPAAAFLDEYPGNRLVLINKTPTPRDDIANLTLHEKLGEVFERL
ncbi:MAG: NAD-dependent protein deacylase [Clostridiales bacterium]|nr:NAD-dependent protein deacylase [Clostridiales bacterium]